MSRVAIAVMMASDELSYRNKDAIIRTYVDRLSKMDKKHEYRVYFYDGGYDEFVVESDEDKFINQLHCVSLDGVYRTFEKTIEALTYINEEFGPDYLVRTNISSFINVVLLDKYIDKMTGVVCTSVNAVLESPDNLNTPFPRGDFYIMPGDILSGVLSVSDKYKVDDSKDLSYVLIGREHVDDVLMGMCIKDFIGEHYSSIYHTVKYSYIPGTLQDCDTGFNGTQLVARVKSCPPNTISGYSWGDNEYRMRDSYKFDRLNELCNRFSKTIQKTAYSDIMIDDFKSKPIICAQYVEVTLGNLKKFLG